MKLVTCKSCGQSIAKSAKTCPHCGAKPKKRTLLWVIAVFVVLVGIGTILDTEEPKEDVPSSAVVEALTPDIKQEEAPKKEDTTVTMAEFEAVETGMTYEEVVAIIGFEGSLNSQVDIGAGEEYKTEIYTWSNLFGSNMNVTFQGGKVMAKAQFGLK